MMNIKRLNPMLGLCAAALLAGTACVDLEVANLNAPDRERAIRTPGDVEALVSGAYRNWWSNQSSTTPNMVMSCVADNHTSSWGNFGMRDNCSEPRIAWNNAPTYGSRSVAANPWNRSYGSLAAVRSGLQAINDGLRIQEPGGPDNTERLVLFGKLIQGLSFATLAVTFDRSFVIDDATTEEDISALETIDYNQMWAEAEAKFAEVIQGAQSASFTIPSDWVGGGGDWSGPRMAEVTRAMRTRYRTQMPRTLADQQALNWSAILADATTGIDETFGVEYVQGGSTSWVRMWPKVYSYIRGWSRTDYRRIGPSDASGNYQKWISAPLDQRTPFEIDTDDRRITAGSPTSDGKHQTFMGNSPFPADRGIYHYSHYIDTRWEYLWQDFRYETFWPNVTPMEMEFIVAEANYWMGDKAATMETVNKYRTSSGELPPFTDVNGVAPGGDRCVPKMADGSCGDLWEAYKYEKRMELFMMGNGTEYFDDRGWEDLVQHSWTQLPIPGQELELLLMDIYTFGGPGGAGAAPDVIDDFSPAGIRSKLRAIELWSEVHGNTDADQIPRRR